MKWTQTVSLTSSTTLTCAEIVLPARRALQLRVAYTFCCFFSFLSPKSMSIGMNYFAIACDTGVTMAFNFALSIKRAAIISCIVQMRYFYYTLAVPDPLAYARQTSISTDRNI